MGGPPALGLGVGLTIAHRKNYLVTIIHKGLADNIKTDFREIGWDGMNWIELAQDRDQWRLL
jgi:hypothetical protein